MKRAGKIVLATLAFTGLCVLVTGAFLASTSGHAKEKGSASEPSGSNSAPRIPVVVTAAKEMTFESRVVVSGNVEAKRFALVSARIPGSLDAVFVDEGDVVEAGKTQLFQTDSVKLSKAVDLARQQLTVAECSVREKQANLEQSIAQNDQAAKDLERYRELARQNAVSAQMFEQQSTQARQAEAMVKHKRALISLAEAELEQARLSLKIAEKDMADSLVVAPINGRVSERMKEPGEMAAPGTPVVKIEDLSVLEACVYIPEEFYGRVQPGKTQIRVRVSGTDLGSHPVSYKSPTVHSKLRTFEVKGVIENPPEEVVPGCLAEISIVLDDHSGVGVPSGAIQRRGDQKVVFALEGDLARMVPVETGREMEGWTEVKGDNLSAGTEIVTLGQALVENGSAVSLVKENAE